MGGIPDPGTFVFFRGGSGRNDADGIQRGVVNGVPIFDDKLGVMYVPVHIPYIDHNVLVATENLLPEDFEDESVYA